VLEETPIFMLAENGKIIAADAGKVAFERLGAYTDTTTGKPVSNLTRYTYTDGDDSLCRSKIHRWSSGGPVVLVGEATE
jgi:hypothetical protein